AFLVALQLLPARQRAVLLLHDVVGWQADETGALLGLSTAAVNSALQRARATIAQRAPSVGEAAASAGAHATLLARYLAAWEASDVAALVALLRDDATLAMPPLPEWLQGPAAIGAALTGMVLVPGSAGAFRLVPTRINGAPAFATYRDGRALSVQVIEIAGD